MTFRERPAGEPEALKAWFYPGREYGDQFVYERSRAMQLATESNEAVLSTPAVLASSTADVLNTAPVEAVSPSGDTVETATVVDTPPVVAATPVASPEPAVAENLPKTASNLPLIGLAGLAMLGGGIVVLGFTKLHA
jgi:LPXTG-motif cell wall-anchored protein